MNDGDSDGKSIVKRDAKGRYPKGVSGNPAGRLTRVTEEKYLDVTMRNCSFDEWAEVVVRAKEDAIEGDAQARDWLTKQLIGLPVKRVERHEVREEQSMRLDKDLLRVTAILGALLAKDALGVDVGRGEDGEVVIIEGEMVE